MMIGLARNSSAASGRTVLVVDDMEANRALLSRRLERSDYAVVSVESGHAALQIVAQAPPDIILLDYMMPHMSGIEVLRELRADPATKDIPVIMVTARVESAATIEALEAGADDYVTKPIDFEVLRARIETHLSKRSSTSGLKIANAALDERVTRRSLAIADLEDELRKETGLRKELEQRLADRPGAAGADIGQEQRPVPGDLAEILARAAERFEFVFEMAKTGRCPNLAQMAEIKVLLERGSSLLSGDPAAR
jgi:DNA-binding response OmpR family regulator